MLNSEVEWIVTLLSTKWGKKLFLASIRTITIAIMKFCKMENLNMSGLCHVDWSEREFLFCGK
jgi:hypothetical protein